MKKIKWGILGSGKIARRFATDLKFLPGAEILGVFSRNPVHVKSFAEEFHTHGFSLQDELLKSDADIVYIGTPHPSHYENVIDCLRSGKAVLCEKPFTMTSRESETIFHLAKEKNLFVMEAMWTRFFPVIGEVLDLIRANEIGKVQSIESSFGYQSQYDPSSRVFNPALGGGSLLDVGVYSLSFARMITGEDPVSVKATATKAPTGVDQSANWALEYPSGVRAIGESSVVNVLANSARIVGTKGEIFIPRFWSPREYSLNGQSKSLPYDGMGFQFEAAHVMDCLRTNVSESPLMSHHHTLQVMRTMEAIMKVW